MIQGDTAYNVWNLNDTRWRLITYHTSMIQGDTAYNVWNLNDSRWHSLIWA